MHALIVTRRDKTRLQWFCKFVPVNFTCSICGVNFHVMVLSPPGLELSPKRVSQVLFSNVHGRWEEQEDHTDQTKSEHG